MFVNDDEANRFSTLMSALGESEPHYILTMNTKEILKLSTDGNILRTIDKEACEKAVDQIIARKKTVREIVDLFSNPKRRRRPTRHALHATAIRVGGPSNEKR